METVLIVIGLAASVAWVGYELWVTYKIVKHSEDMANHMVGGNEE